nr:hemolysin family protein [Nitrospirillum iridis]
MLYLQVAILVLLILLNGFFAMSELAVLSARRSRLATLAEKGHRGARTALALQENPSHFLSTVQIGITMIAIVEGAFGSATLSGPLAEELAAIPALAPHAESIAVTLVVVCITLLSLIVGELVPKRLALHAGERIALVTAPFLLFLSRAAAPIAWLLGTVTELLLRMLGAAGKPENAVTEEEVKSLIAEGTAAGVFEPEEKRMIEGVLGLSDRPARAIMTPRLDVMWLDLDDDVATLTAEIQQSPHSRFPVCRGSLDEVVGILHAKAVLDAVLAGETPDLAKLANPALIVHDGTQVMRLLELFRASSQQMALVVDEYGSAEGIVTLTDILESIAGDMPEAHDADEDEFVRREDGSMLIDGRMAIDEASSVLDLPGLRNGGDYLTLAGFLLFKLGHLPRVGEGISHAGYRFEVVDMDGRRIDKILVIPPAE